MINRWTLSGMVILISYASASQDTARLMFYNLLDFPEAPPSNRELILRNILAEINPDILMVAELQNQTGADLILNESLNINNNNFSSVPFVFNTSGGSNVQQLLYFNTNKFNLIKTDIIETSLRDINRYQLEARTTQVNTNPILIDFFVAHFKASQGSSNEQIRFDMAFEFTNYINANLNNDANVVFAGDFNFYSADESGLQQLFIGNTTIPMNDPINQLGEWHSNSSFSAFHTQSTRESNNTFNNFGAGGGLDDRFDFMFISGNLLDPNHEVNYVTNSYQTFGNNTNCYNEDVSDGTCTGFYSQTLRNLLWNMSDHLPLVMDLKFEQDFLDSGQFKNEVIFSFPNGNIASHNLEIKITPYYLNQIDNFYLFNTLGALLKIIPVESTHISVSTYDLPNGIYFIKSYGNNPLKFIASN